MGLVGNLHLFPPHSLLLSRIFICRLMRIERRHSSHLLTKGNTGPETKGSALSFWWDPLGSESAFDKLEAT